MLKKHGGIKFVINLLIYLLYIIIIPIIVYDIFLIVQIIVTPEKTPNFFGYKTFTIISESMEPTLSIGDVVIVKEVDLSRIQTNDIITFRAGKETITHRVINININAEDGELIYVTKGDSNEVTDIENVEYKHVEGKYVTKIPKIGNLLSFLKNKLIFGCILILLIICYILQRKVIQKKQERKEKREQYERTKRLQ